MTTEGTLSRIVNIFFKETMPSEQTSCIVCVNVLSGLSIFDEGRECKILFLNQLFFLYMWVTLDDDFDTSSSPHTCTYPSGCILQVNDIGSRVLE